MKQNKSLIKKAILLMFMFWCLGLAAQNPPDIILVFYLDENSPDATLVGTVVATDPDQDPLTYSIISGNDDNAFAINSTTGDLTVNDQTLLDFETTPVFDLMVEADDGNGGMTIASVTIRLNDLDEALGLDDSPNLKVYPNPVNDILIVDFSESQWKSTALNLYSINGKLISINEKFLGTNKTAIDFTTLNEGVYILEIKNGKGKIFRQRIFAK